MTKGNYTFTEGVLSTFLQHSQQRKRRLYRCRERLSRLMKGNRKSKLEFRPLLSCYYTGDVKEAFNSKGQFKSEISLKGQHLPGSG